MNDIKLQQLKSKIKGEVNALIDRAFQEFADEQTRKDSRTIEDFRRERVERIAANGRLSMERR